jgi:hypothetical protein
MNGADEVEEFDDMTEAIARARKIVLLGYPRRAIVVDETEDDIYDTAHDEAVKPSLSPLPEVGPIGPRQRNSPLAERVLA